MDEPKGFGPSSDYDWRWWHSVLGTAIAFAIVAIISWW
jgi:hypothetical protein